MFQRHPSCKPELLTLVYGLYVTRLLEEVAETQAVEHANSELLRIGFKIGTRLIDEYLARSTHLKSCKSFRKVLE